MYKKLFFLLFVISGIVIFTFPVQAMMCWDDMMGWFGGGKGHKQGEEMQKGTYSKPNESLEGRFYVDLKDELDLTNVQVKALDEIGREYESKKAKKVSTIDKIEGELVVLQAKRNPDMEEIKKRVDETENLRKEIRWNYIKSVEKAKKLLTNEQLDRLSRIGKENTKKIEKNSHGEGTSHGNTATKHEGMVGQGGMQ